MNRGFLATLFAAAFSFAGLQAAYSAAPVISNLPDYIRVGDGEPADNPGGSDGNFFIFTNAFQFSASVSDADTPDADLKWSFGEYNGVGTSDTDRYQINGVEPIAKGSAAVAALDLAGGPTAPGANQINSGAVGSAGDYATLRDVDFSPTNLTAPFPEPGNQEKADAALGKTVRFYVTDGDNVTSDSVHVSSVDDALDEASSEIPPIEEMYDEASDFLGWAVNGIDDGPDVGGPANEDSVDVTTTTDRLIVDVKAATSRTRIHGFRNANIGVYPGADKYIRGKFYIHTSNAAGAAVNTVPGFRLRIDNVDAIQSEISVIPANTGNTGPAPPNASPGGPNGNWNFYNDLANDVTLEQKQTAFLRPSGNAAKPSLYRVDLDPIDVPAATNSKIFAVFQSYTTANPSAGQLQMTECTVLTYPALVDSAGVSLFTYDRLAGTTAAQDVNASLGFFNADNDLRNGYRQFIQLGAPFDTTASNLFATLTNDATGLTVDTTNTPVDQFGVGLLNIGKGVNDTPSAGAHFTRQIRVQPNKLYKARFYATSSRDAWSNNTTAVRQGNLRFRIQVGNYANYLWLQGPLRPDYNDPGVTSQDPFMQSTGDILRQAIPSNNSANPEVEAAYAQTGQDGGWYTVLSTSPLSDDIRQDVAGSTATKFGAFFSEPGPGQAGASMRTMLLGADATKMAQNLRVGNGTSSVVVPFFAPNVANVRVHKIVLHEFDQINDGGYAY